MHVWTQDFFFPSSNVCYSFGLLKMNVFVMYDEREIVIYSAFPFVKKKLHKKEIGISIQSLLLKLNMSSVLNMLNDANYVR